MMKICPKCGRIMSYDPYFKANICRQCGETEAIQTNSALFRSNVITKINIQKHKLVVTR